MLWTQKIARRMAVLMLCGVFPLLASCQLGAEREFRAVQICVHDESGVAELKALLRALASSEQMNFVDGSAQTTQDLAAIARKRGKPPPSIPVLNVGVERGDSMGLTAGNLGLPRYQIAIGFTQGSDQRAARAFSDRVVSALGQHWSVEALPAGRGALPSPSCDDGSRAGLQ